MTRVLTYVRPWNRDQFVHLARNIWPSCSLTVLSEHRRVDESGFCDVMARNMSMPPGKNVLELSEEQRSDIIIRCRLLRIMRRSEAEKYISATLSAFSTILDRDRPEAIISISVDSYIQHILYILSKERHIPFVGLIPSFIRGYFRVTAIGEHLPIREVGVEEMESVEGVLCDPTYKPSYLVQSSSEMERRALRSWLSNNVKPAYFSMKSLLPGGRHNYHYLASRAVSARYWSPKPTRYAGADYDGVRAMISESSLRGANVFLPLQMSPECTIDYWSSDTTWINYESRVIQLIDDYAASVTFFVKEHPNLLGYRTRRFYEELGRRENCRLVSPRVPSNVLLPLFDGVVICTGSVGVEAAIRGVQVFSDCRPFHLPATDVLPLARLSSLSDKSGRPVNRDRADRSYIIQRLLEGLLPGRFVNDGSWKKDSDEDRQAGLQMARVIYEHLPRIERLQRGDGLNIGTTK